MEVILIAPSGPLQEILLKYIGDPTGNASKSSFISDVTLLPLAYLVTNSPL